MKMVKQFTMLILSGLFLISCVSYKPLDTPNYQVEEGKRYKIYLQNGKKRKLRITDVNEGYLKGRNYYGKEYTLEREDILTLKKSKFSLWKTLLIPVGVLGGAGILFITSWDINLGGSIGVPN